MPRAVAESSTNTMRAHRRKFDQSGKPTWVRRGMSTGAEIGVCRLAWFLAATTAYSQGWRTTPQRNLNLLVNERQPLLNGSLSAKLADHTTNL